MARLLIMFVLLSILSGCGGGSASFSLKDEQETNDRAKILIYALETYHQDHSAYPSTLALLVPNYLPAMIQTSKGTKFHYEWSEKEDFYVLSIQEADCHYRSSPSRSTGYEGHLVCSEI